MLQVTVIFPEVILLDTTYCSNKLKMPLFIFMVVDGFGSSHVVAFCSVTNGLIVAKHQAIVSHRHGQICCALYNSRQRCVTVEKDQCAIAAVRDSFDSQPIIQLCEFHIKRAFKIVVGNRCPSPHDKAKLNSVLGCMVHALNEQTYLHSHREFEHVANDNLHAYLQQTGTTLSQ